MLNRVKILIYDIRDFSLLKSFKVADIYISFPFAMIFVDFVKLLSKLHCTFYVCLSKKKVFM